MANAWPSLLWQQLDRSLLLRGIEDLQCEAQTAKSFSRTGCVTGNPEHIDLYGVVCTVSLIFTLQVQTYELISTFDA